MSELNQFYPTNVSHAIQLLFRYLSNDAKVTVAIKAESELPRLKPSLGKFILKEFDLMSNNRLLESCRTLYNKDDISSEDASQIIVKELWKRLREINI